MKKFKGDNFKRSVAKFGTSNLDDEALNSYASSWGLFWLKCLKGYALELSTVAYDLHMILVDFSTSISYQCALFTIPVDFSTPIFISMPYLLLI